MAILQLRTAPDPILRRKASRVAKIDASIQTLIDDMFDTMYEQRGVGLAANQVGVPLRILVMGVPGEDDDEAVKEIVLVNPQFIRKSGERVVDEGCLSIPGYRGELTRAVSVKVKALDREGNEIRIKAAELMSQALEHEMDHLDGILYIDRMKEQGTLETLSAIDKHEESEKPAA